MRRLEALEDARILIVDDQETNIFLLGQLLKRAGYKNVRSTTDSRQALNLLMTDHPDIILLDLHMPHLDGHEILNQIKDFVPDGYYLPVLVLTADMTPEAKERALAAGARDFLTKPFDHVETLLRIRNLLETRHLHLQLHEHNMRLEEKVTERTAELERARLETLERLALAAEFRDDETGQHTYRVGRISSRIAETMGLESEFIAAMRLAAPLHDVGKIGIPDGILLKPGKLTPNEFETVKTHTTIGAQILSGSSSALLVLAEEIALTHHERWDGFGYAGMAGEGIPLSGRIVAVADVFDALIHDRPYKDAWAISDAVAEIESQADAQFDVSAVKAFLEVINADEIDATQEEAAL